MLIHMRANASRTSKGFSVDGTVSWDTEINQDEVGFEISDRLTDDLRAHVTKHLSALMASLDARFPREGEQTGNGAYG